MEGIRCKPSYPCRQFPWRCFFSSSYFLLHIIDMLRSISSLGFSNIPFSKICNTSREMAIDILVGNKREFYYFYKLSLEESMVRRVMWLVPQRPLIKMLFWLSWMVKEIFSLWEEKIHPKAVESEGRMYFSERGVINLLLQQFL